MAEMFFILSQQQTQELGPGGTVQDVMEITFQTVSGVIATERVPLSLYTPENVAALLSERAKVIEQVQSL